MWWSVGILLGPAILAIVAYLAMINVKPRVIRPVSSTTVQTEIQALEARLMAHVQILAMTIGERNLSRPRSLQAAADYIRQVWEGQGFEVTEERLDILAQPCANLVIERRGSGQPGSIILVGAHYDTVLGSPGANDNATGVAALLELSRDLRREIFGRTVRLAAFVNEEPPYFRTEMMGSAQHARQARKRQESIAAMISLETLGYYSSANGSQRYPFPFGAFYPRTGNFLGVVGNLSSRGIVVTFLREFMSVSDFPVEGIATFEWIPGINWSDHSSFWKEGYPAVMLTDTAPFRYPQYHSSRDLADEINAPEFARAAHGIIRTLRRMAGRR